MSVPLTFRKNGFPYTREASDVLYAESAGQNCILHFENGDTEFYGYPLKFFHQKVWSTNLFRRLHRSYLVKMSKVISQVWLKAILFNGKIISLSRKGHKRVKKHLSGIMQSTPEKE
ncbi:MAG: LytTR family transcriptional regulator [Bacteroidetes bacterium]|nr:LytTR family transcriptional regulator [Bacteroidota bacterium]